MYLLSNRTQASGGLRLFQWHRPKKWGWHQLYVLGHWNWKGTLEGTLSCFNYHIGECLSINSIIVPSCVSLS